MFASLGRVAHTRRWFVLAAAGAFLAVGIGWGAGVVAALVGGGFEDPASESQRALARAEQSLGRQSADVIVVYTSASLTVADPAFRDAVTDSLENLPADDVATTTTYWSTGSNPALASPDGRSTFATITLTGTTDSEREEQYDALAADLVVPGLSVLRGGPAAVGTDIGTQVEADLVTAELISLPVLLVLLLFVFGGLVAASLPLAIGGLAIVGAFTALRLITLVTDVSIFAVNIVTMLGLGLAIDYALFVVSRFREELALRPRSDDPDAERTARADALVATMDTAGRTVAVSGLTVAVALAALTLFPQLFLRSMGFGGMAAVLVAMIGALTVLPALLAVLGRRVDALRVPFPYGARHRPRSSEHGGWARLAGVVMRRPIPIAVATMAVLVALGAPALGISFGGVDTRVLPEGTESRVAAETLARDFPSTSAAPIEVVVTGAATTDLTSYVSELATLPGATGSELVAQARGTALVEVYYAGEAIDRAALDLVEAVRALAGPPGAEVLVTGTSAEHTDLLGSLAAHAPMAIGFVILATLLLLFLAFGSVLLPVKAVIMNILSLGATMGVLVWGFQEGGLEGILGFTVTGTVEATQPVLILAVAFGLSMDYEVFLLSRVREEWDRTGDNVRAVTAGMQRSGRIITSAALLLMVVFIAFATSGITFIQMIGVGVATAILVDATIVRALLVPATMRLLGSANWWLPAPLGRVYRRFGFREEVAGDAGRPASALALH